MEYQEQEKSHRLRTIIITVLIILFVVIVGIWLVSAAINSARLRDNDEARPAEEVSTSQPNDHPAVAEPSSTSISTSPSSNEANSPADQYQKNDTPDTPASSPVSTTPSSRDIPSTGPEDILFSVFLVGVAVYLAGLNLQLVKSR